MSERIVIIGAGPAGLALAINLASTGLAVTVIEQQSEDVLAYPVYDGREIALTHTSIATLQQLGAWQRIPNDAIFPLAEARVFNRKSPLALSFDAGKARQGQLGSLVSNYHIKRALFNVAREIETLELHCGASVEDVSCDQHEARVWLESGAEHSASLLVAADSRFSTVRAMLGIPTQMKRLGKSMLVGRVALDHDHDHGGIATEWFDEGQTLAMLPLGDREASVVVTLADGEAQRLAAQDKDALGAELTRRYAKRFGTLRPLTSLQLYPLTTTYAQRFIAPRAALVGDAAVGMHPVTAHGFNLGLAGTQRLSSLIISAIQEGRDPASPHLLRRYQNGHRAATLPLYLATNVIAGLYTDDSKRGLIARRLAFNAARAAPARMAVSRMLMRGT